MERHSIFAFLCLSSETNLSHSAPTLCVCTEGGDMQQFHTSTIWVCCRSDQAGNLEAIMLLWYDGSRQRHVRCSVFDHPKARLCAWELHFPEKMHLSWLLPKKGDAFVLEVYHENSHQQSAVILYIVTPQAGVMRALTYEELYARCLTTK